MASCNAGDALPAAARYLVERDARDRGGASVLGPAWGCTVAQALRMYARGGACRAFDEARRGQLAPGFLADLIVLAADPLAVPLDELPDVPVDLTVVDGWVVHERG